VRRATVAGLPYGWGSKVVRVHVPDEEEEGISRRGAVEPGEELAVDRRLRVLVSVARLRLAEPLHHALEHLHQQELRVGVVGAEDEVWLEVAVLVEALPEVEEGRDVVVGDEARRVSSHRRRKASPMVVTSSGRAEALLMTAWLEGKRPVRIEAKLGRVHEALAKAWSKRTASAAKASRLGLEPEA